MVDGQEANGSLLKLQGLEASDVTHPKPLAGATEQGCISFAFAIYTNIHNFT